MWDAIGGVRVLRSYWGVTIMSFGRCRGTLPAWMCLWLIAPGVVRAERLPTTVFSARDGIAPAAHSIVVIPKVSSVLRSRGWPASTATDSAYSRTPMACPPAARPTSSSAAMEPTGGRRGPALHVRPPPPSPAVPMRTPETWRHQRASARRGTLWCGTDTGLWRRPVNGASPWELVRMIEPGADGRPAVYRLLKDTRGDVATAALFSGLYRLRSNGRVDAGLQRRGCSPIHVLALSETPDGIWVGSSTELMRFEIIPTPGKPGSRLGPAGLPDFRAVIPRVFACYLSLARAATARDPRRHP